jgi:hypothetical protein
MKLAADEAPLRKIAAVVASDKTPFARFFPDIAFLSVKNKDGQETVYSIIHNREHDNISWITAESLRMLPKEDSLIVRKGFWGSYPNMFFKLQESQLNEFSERCLKIKKTKEYEELVRDFGVPRTQSNFWFVYDGLNAVFKKEFPEDFGYLDLTRYDMTP